MKNSFNDRKFISRNFGNEQALSMDVIYNDGVHTQCNIADSLRKPKTEILSHVALQLT